MEMDIYKEKLKDGEFLINMGPQHPSTHGVLRLMLKMEGEYIRALEPHVGYLHRSIEKIAENRTYNQFMPFTDRIDYCASTPSNLAFAMAVEKLAQRHHVARSWRGYALPIYIPRT